MEGLGALKFARSFRAGIPRHLGQNQFPMMFFVAVLSVMAYVAVLLVLARMKPLFAGLTVRYSWQWALVAAVSLLASVVLSGRFFEISPAVSSLLQLLSVVLMMTPAVSTLGARNPGVSAWQVFVVVPLIIVLLWPGLSDLLSSRGKEPLRLGIPAFSGLCLVLLMSMSTCVGTSLTFASLFFFSAVSLGLFPAMGWMDLMSPWQSVIPFLLLSAVVLSARSFRIRGRAIETARTRSELIDASWTLFQDFYGLVWARRIQERVNQFASREKWNVLLTHEGFRDADGNSPSDEDLEKPREALRWVLSRFADDQWIAEKLYRLG